MPEPARGSKDNRQGVRKIMIRKMMRTTLAAAGLAALMLTGACAHDTAATEDDTNRVVEVRPDDAAAAGVMPGPAIADSDGNVYSSSAAPGHGNASTVGTNTNVNRIAGESSVTVREEPAMTTPTTSEVATVDTARDLDTSRDADTTVTTTDTTTTRTETVEVPMTSAAQEPTTTTTTTTETTTPARTRLRKD
jgi:hypothetical protein